MGTIRRTMGAALASVLAAAGAHACVPAEPTPAVLTERERREALEPGWAQPDATNTGVLPDVALTPADSAIVTLDVAGTVYEDRDVPCLIRIRAADITIRNVRVRGDCPAGSGQPASSAALISATHVNVDDAVIEHVTLAPTTPDVDWGAAVMGHDYTLRFADISRVVDGARVFNTNAPKDAGGRYLAHPSGAVLRQNFIHDLAWFTGPAPGVVHPTDTETHDDAIQHQGGTGTIIEGNALVARYARQVAHWRTTTTTPPYTTVPLRSLPDGGPHQTIPDRGTGNEANGRYNTDDLACLMIGDEVGPTHDLTFNMNWCYGGNYGVNGGGNAPYDAAARLGTMVLNRFDRSQASQSTGGDNTHTITLGGDWVGRVVSGAGTAYQNVYMDNGHPINFRGD